MKSILDEWRQLLRGLIVLAVLIRADFLEAQDKPIKFDRIALEHGLSQSTVKCILQDRKGFMWFGTQDGLNKYDGYRFTVYKHDVLDSNSLSENWIEAIFEDHTGMLWIGTWGGGLNRFDREKEKFTRFVNDPNNPRSISHNDVTAIYEDRGGTLWIGTRGGGLNRFAPNQEQFIHFVNDPQNPHSLSHNNVNAIYEDQTGTLWIGTDGGLSKFDRDRNQFTRFLHDPQNPYSLSHNSVWSICEDPISSRSAGLWIGTWGGGLNRFDRGKEQFTRFVNDSRNPHSLSHNYVRSIYADSTRKGFSPSRNTLWIGTGDGLNKLVLSPASSGVNSGEGSVQFTRFVNDPTDPHSLSDDNVYSIYGDRFGILWIGTARGGINKLDRDQEQFTHFFNDPNNPHSLSHNWVISIYGDHAGTMWIGTAGGLNKFDREKEQFTRFIHDPNNLHSLSQDRIVSIYEDHTGALWIGTSGGGLNKLVLSPASNVGEGSDRAKVQFTHMVDDPKSPLNFRSPVRSIHEDTLPLRGTGPNTLWFGTTNGLFKFDHAKKQCTRFVNDPNNPYSLSHNYVFAIYEDRSGTLWIGTFGGGLNKLDRDREQFTRFVHDPKNPRSLSHNRVYIIYEDSHRAGLWIGTHGGLNQFDRAAGQFTHYTEKDGLPHDVIYGILEDDHGYLWLSTNKGLSRFDPRTKTFKNYEAADGLQSNEFNTGAYYRSRNGEMFFGGINGFNAFYPDRIRDNPYIPPVAITAFKIFDKPAKLPRAIEALAALELSYRDDFFSFEFAALHYANPQKNQYAYKLEGFDQDWIYCGTRRYASYTNLDPGEYVFRVKGANNDGFWNEEGASIRITITPPWWRTGWAYALYALLLIIGIFATDRIQRRRVIQKERALAQIREAELRAEAAELHVKAAEAQAKALATENERKEIELQKSAELKAAYQALAEAHERLKTTQAQLIHAEKMASLGQLTAGIAHEIKNPLNFVNNFAALSMDLMQELRDAIAKQNEKPDTETKEELREVLRLLEQNAAKISEHGKRADNIVKGMLMHSRGESGERRPADINAILDEYVDLAFHGMRGTDSTFNIKIEKAYDSSIGRVEVFPQDLSRVFLNLVNNACYATREKKKALGDSYSPVLTVRTQNLGDKIDIRIRDNGNGIPLDIREKIFNPFFTTKPTGQGTGLGLSISYDIIVQQHKGEIKVETEEGKFTEFVLSLPKQA